MNLRQQHTAALVASFLAKGGTIRKLAPARPTVASDILDYLQNRNVDVHTITGSDETKYVYKGEVITLKTLLSIANRHRRRRRLPPFQLANSLN